ncbi:MAG TPA: hypothetical protein VLS45_06335, partial [Methylomicrobium sp.]|nr:hypothetical protein [Methylomicrobium sp.]
MLQSGKSDRLLELKEPLPKVTLQDIKEAITSHNYSALKELVKHFDVNIGDTRLKNRYSVKDIDNPLALAILL